MTFYSNYSGISTHVVGKSATGQLLAQLQILPKSRSGRNPQEDALLHSATHTNTNITNNRVYGHGLTMPSSVSNSTGSRPNTCSTGSRSTRSDRTAYQSIDIGYEQSIPLTSSRVTSGPPPPLPPPPPPPPPPITFNAPDLKSHHHFTNQNHIEHESAATDEDCGADNDDRERNERDKRDKGNHSDHYSRQSPNYCLPKKPLSPNGSQMSLFDMDQVRLVELQASGAFGRMYSAVYQDLLNCEEKDIVVKTLIVGCSKAAQSAFVRQGVLLQGLKHKHLLSCTLLAKENRPPMLLYSQLQQRNLKNLLRQRQNQTDGFTAKTTSIRLLPPRLLVRLSIHLADAIRYIHDHYLLHKDVAARNCYVSGLDESVQGGQPSNHNRSESIILRLADNALSRDMFVDDYADSYHAPNHPTSAANRSMIKSDEARPIRWMAYECLMGNAYSRPNDVWAFAVTVWEMLTLGEQPYESIGTNEIAKLLW